MLEGTRDSMKCSLCGSEMEHGRVQIGQSGLGFLVAGMALPHLFSVADSGETKSVFGWKDSDAAAHRCPNCGVVMFQGDRE